MGYSTYYTMSTIPEGMWNSTEVKSAIKQVTTNPKYGNPFPMSDYFKGEEYDFEEEMKWYEHDDEMKNLSSLCPNIIFILEGSGEESGDWWKSIYFRGEQRTVVADIPDINISDWRLLIGAEKQEII